ncbi:MAG: DUF1565 domain-containing protein [Candidatus Cloacimonetes bacterium]|nr:DUF1565 domain-containing protein [Candidatus Cloacimonadota bacterium]
MMKKKAMLIIWLILMTGAFAVTISIPADYATIQEGIDASADGDEIIVSPGTYMENINFAGKAVILGSLFYTTQDTSYISQTIIDGDQNGSVIIFVSYEDSTSLLTGFTITNGCADHGGGIKCNNSSPSIANITIAGNSAVQGGGISCNNSSPGIANVTIANNLAEGAGGGISCNSSSLSLANVTIRGNLAGYAGGGIFCSYSSPGLANVKITANLAEYGGGIYCYSSNPVFSSENLCNIYLNNTNYRSNGCDIYSDINDVSVIVDTFTVSNPTNFHAYPIANFSFDILHGLQDQINADLYVSPEGDNSNTGLTIAEPLKTIQYACSVILADSQNLHTIHLAGGTYSSSTNGEFFPVDIPDYVSICGVSEIGVVLNAEGMAGVIRLSNTENAAISNLTITNGYAEQGGGIYCEFSSLIIENVTITGNYTGSYGNGGGIYCNASSLSLEHVKLTDNYTGYYGNGGGIYCEFSSPDLLNVTIKGNSAYHGGGVNCYYSSPSLAHVTITDNYADYGGGICCQSDSSPGLANVTIADNLAESEGGGIFCRVNSSPSIVNCILWQNSPQEVEFYSDSDPNTITIAYSDIEGGEGGIETHYNGTVNWLAGNISAAPLFMNSQMGNYLLTEESPCIDAGIAYFEYESEVLVDISEAEYNDAAPDMGAYECTYTSFNHEEIEPVKECVTIYPNPFNPETNILFELFFGSNVLIEIYNTKGQKVTTLINESFDAGSHKVTWNAEDYGSGIYLLRLNTAEKSEIKKLILLK